MKNDQVHLAQRDTIRQYFQRRRINRHSLHRNIAMFFRGSGFSLGAQNLERIDQSRSGFTGQNNGVNVSPAGSYIGIGKKIVVLLDLLLALGA